MKLFKSNIEILKRAAPAKMGRRFLAGVVDMLLVVLLTVLLMQVATPIIEEMDSYKDAKTVVDSEIKYYDELITESYIVDYIDGVRVSEDIMAYKNLIRAIYRSYKLLGNQDFVFETIYEKSGYSKDKLKEEILSEDDSITDFYTKFLPTYDPNGKIVSTVGLTPEEILVNVYKEAFGNDYSALFRESEEDKLPVLDDDIAFLIFHYLFEDKTDADGERGANYYEMYINAYKIMLYDSELLMIKSEPYYTEHYIVFREYQSIQVLHMNIGLIIMIFISSLVVLLLPKYLFKFERTLGYKIFGLGVINMNNEANPWYVSLIKTLLEFIGLISASVFVYLFSPFNGVYDALLQPFDFTLPEEIRYWFSLGGIILVITILTMVINGFGLFTHYRQTLINLIFNDKVVDVKLIDQGDQDDKFEGRPY